MDSLFNSSEDVKLEATKFRSINDARYDGSLQYKIKEETELDTYAKEDNTWKIETKLEAPNSSGHDDSIKLELLHEELDIKPEILVHYEEETSNLDQYKQFTVGKQPFKCSLICNYASARKHALTTHMNTHTGEKPYKCGVCGYGSVKKSKLGRHAQTHTGEKPFKSIVCVYGSVEKSTLGRHMKTHTGEKPFKCSVCDYASVRKSLLAMHMKSHTGEKPFKCNVCGYGCVEKSNLGRHMKTHTGAKPFKCSLCDYGCDCKSNLAKHIKTHTKSLKGASTQKKLMWLPPNIFN